jgi:hypothetical protein
MVVEETDSTFNLFRVGLILGPSNSGCGTSNGEGYGIGSGDGMGDVSGIGGESGSEDPSNGVSRLSGSGYGGDSWIECLYLGQ